MLVTTADSDEHVEEYATPYMSAKPTKDGKKINVVRDGFRSTARMHVFPGLILSAGYRYCPPVHARNMFWNTFVERARRVRTLCFVLLPVPDVVRLTISFLGEYVADDHMITCHGRVQRVRFCACKAIATFYSTNRRAVQREQLDSLSGQTASVVTHFKWNLAS